MDFFDVLLQAGLTTAALVVYLIFIRKRPPPRRVYTERGWNYPLKWLFARFYAVNRWKTSRPAVQPVELPVGDMFDGWDAVSVRTTAADGSAVLLTIRKLCGRQPMAEVAIYIRLPDGSTYCLPQHPDTAVGVWENTDNSWSAGGLKIQVLETEIRWRILFNGILARLGDGGKTQHVKFNFIWRSGTTIYREPQDWSEQLAAHTLALEQWRDGSWPDVLAKWEENGWVQWGMLQGRFQSYDEHGVPDNSAFLRMRGLRDRRWAPHGYQGLRQCVTVAAIARDGTAVYIRGLSYRNVLKECISGCVRLPNAYIKSITYTDFDVSSFGETADGIPKAFTINVSTKDRTIKLVVRSKPDGGRLLSGIPYQQEIRYRRIIVDIDGEPGSGFLELGFQPSVNIVHYGTSTCVMLVITAEAQLRPEPSGEGLKKAEDETSEPRVQMYPGRTLKWLSSNEVGDVGYCAALSTPIAACPDYVGGKGASLALLSTVQDGEGYKVPPGFCLTTRALEKHLAMNPEMLTAIRSIEAANENYNEANFKDKCAKTVELFLTTDVTNVVRDEILAHLNVLRREATAQALEQRFAVRSSAVGEDSDTLSAAGQNDTILGCVSDDDVLRGVQKCWASMFAFTSAYYRRQNGQPCQCGGGVVVQAMVAPRAAGVMFTRHPDAGDPTRVLITANYGLGESVVSGSVEPDTIIVKRHYEGDLTISKIDVGSKKQRVTTSDGGVATEDVPEEQRHLPCLSESQILRLARIGVSQDQLWGAGRDIEWAVTENDIYLLQARPITSLERWTEEELLHELDHPIMSDDDLSTFANTGEVLPKPISPLGYDLMIRPLMDGMNKMIDPTMDPFEDSLVVTHYRCTLSLYNSSYRRVPDQVDTGIRMLEMSIHGHKVADQHIINTALHRRRPTIKDKIEVLLFGFLKPLFISKRVMNKSIKIVNNVNISTENKKPVQILNDLCNLKETMRDISENHVVTSAASTGSQFIAMAVLLEGIETDFTPEQCNEISTILSSGDVLSAEVPQGLAKLAKQLQDSGMFEEFKAQDPNTAMQWLGKNLPHVHLDVLEFLKDHGHRAIMEFDIATKPWVLVPEELIKVLQRMKTSQGIPVVSKSEAEIIDALKTPKKQLSRKILRWVLPLCKHMVRNRESTKAYLIRAVHKLRVAAIELGKLLERQWYLPHHDLVFYFFKRELYEYLQTRDPALLRKAIQRQQYFPKWAKLKFPEICKGWPEPLEVKGPTLTTGDARIEATSVYGGEVIARACVVKDLSEIHQLQQGDVLITHATDIGWSPYFPLLTGIVTELGGLISHGAVIAREYGLPCIVGATSATDIFKTGDTVRLSGTLGIIETVQVAEDPDKDTEEKTGS